MRKALVAVLTAGLVGVPALPSYAGPEHCPEGVAAVRGYNPAWDKVSAWIEQSAAAHDVPAAVLKAIAYRESAWAQYRLPEAGQTGGGLVKVSSDGVCGVGIMQVTADGRDDALKLAEDPAYNIDEGAKILRQKWEVSQTTPPPADSAPDDEDVLENWYYAICLYNGCNGSSDAYARAVAEIVADPFRRIPWGYWQWVRPAGFTMPHEADPSYVFPSAFQARHTAEGGTFVFYDHTTGTVTKTVAARTHRASAPPVVTYPARTTGPDDPYNGWRETICGVCGGWRLAEGVGLAGRAHWTNTVTTAPQSSIHWYNHEPGRYRVSAYVPALGSTVLGKATYRVRPTRDETKHYTLPVVDQQARKGTWVHLGDWSMDGNAKVYLNDGSSVAGQPIVADGVRFTPIPTLTIRAYRQVESDSVVPAHPLDYGQSHRLAVTYSYPPQPDDPVAGRMIKIYRRVVGTTAWQMLGAWPTDASGSVYIGTKPHASMEYTARFTSPDNGVTVTDAASGVVRVGVRPAITGRFAQSTVTSGATVRVYGTVAPNHAGRHVYLQRFYSGAWRTVTYRPMPSSGPVVLDYRFSQPCCQRGVKHLFRVHLPAHTDHLAGYSPVLTLVMNS